VTSSLEHAFATLWMVLGGPENYEREYRFHATRRWRFDIAWPALRIAIELEGGTWTYGAHTRGNGYAEDCEKYNAAVLAGWAVFRLTSDMVADAPTHLDPIIKFVRQAQHEEDMA